MRRIGIVSGKGILPNLLAEEAKRLGHYVAMIALDPVADAMSASADEVKRINVGKLGEIIKALKAAGVREVVMAGKVSKGLLYRSRIKPDLRAVKLLFKLKDKKDDTILQAITDEIESEGLKVIRTTDLAGDLLMPEGVLAGGEPGPEEYKDIRFGFQVAKEIGRLDVGQTVVVKDRAVMAVEAIEGTDEAIRRGGLLAGGGAVVVKVSKPQQDMRYDVPVVGPETLRAMAGVKASVLAVEAGKAIVVHREEMLAVAADAGISVVGVR